MNTYKQWLLNEVGGWQNPETDEEEEGTITPQQLQAYLGMIAKKVGDKAAYFRPLFALVKTKPLAVKRLAELIGATGQMSTGQFGSLQTRAGMNPGT